MTSAVGMAVRIQKQICVSFTPRFPTKVNRPSLRLSIHTGRKGGTTSPFLFSLERLTSAGPPSARGRTLAGPCLVKRLTSSELPSVKRPTAAWPLSAGGPTSSKPHSVRGPASSELPSAKGLTFAWPPSAKRPPSVRPRSQGEHFLPLALLWLRDPQLFDALGDHDSSPGRLKEER